LRPDRRAWEIGLIVREPGQEDHEHHWLIDAADLDLGNADLMALKVGRYHDRHPQAQGGCFSLDPGEVTAELTALWEVEQLTRGAHLVGAVVSFDAEVLAARMRAHGICPSWHYHLIDVEALAAGYLASAAEDGAYTPELRPPWKSDDLSA